MIPFKMNPRLKKAYFLISITAILVSAALLFFNQSKDKTTVETNRISQKKSLSIGTSFMMDISRKYVYQNTKTKSKTNNGKLQKWEYKTIGWYEGKRLHTFTEDTFGLRDIENNAALLISYPIIVGKKWYVEDSEMTLVRIFDEMTVPAGNFKNVIEVSQSNEEHTKISYRRYYAENVGLIRSETGEGKLLSELVKLH